MTNLDAYKQCVEEIRKYASEHNVSHAQMTEIFEECFRHLEKKYSKESRRKFKIIRVILTFLFVFFVSFICAYNHPSLNATLVRNLQNSIYPGLNLLRKLAVPIINLYPRLSELYDETCLVENPYFYVYEIDCWPCSDVHSIPDLTGHNITRSFNIGIPYTKLENDTKVDMKDLTELYWNDHSVFEQDANRVSSNDIKYRTVRDVMYKRLDLYPSETLDTHISWRINRMQPGRILRKIFPKPVETPKWWSQSTEKFILIDEANSPPYSFPNPECSNVVIRCTSGARLIKMIPSAECLQNCKESTILLSSEQTLWYNWWYWRPISLPVSNSTAISIVYLTSFC